MYVLTKRGISTHGEQWHRIYGITPDVVVARAWYRATRVTDVFEFNPRVTPRYQGDPWGSDQDEKSIICESRRESWREQQAREDLERAKQAKS